MPQRGARTAAAAGPTHDAERLEHLERTIKAGITTFVSVGLALAEIRNDKLYRLTHATFETYCRDRWQFTRQRAYQLIGAAEVAGTLECQPGVDISEKALRPLVSIPAEERKAVWTRASKAAGGKPVTAKHVIAAVKEDIAVEQPVVIEIGSNIMGTQSLATYTERADIPDKYTIILDAFEGVADAAGDLLRDLAALGYREIPARGEKYAPMQDSLVRVYSALRSLKLARRAFGDEPEPEQAQLHRGRRVLESDDLGPIVVAKAVSP